VSLAQFIPHARRQQPYLFRIIFDVSAHTIKSSSNGQTLPFSHRLVSMGTDQAVRNLAATKQQEFDRLI
jgi:hypothetical protein